MQTRSAQHSMPAASADARSPGNTQVGLLQERSSTQVQPRKALRLNSRHSAPSMAAVNDEQPPDTLPHRKHRRSLVLVRDEAMPDPPAARQSAALQLPASVTMQQPPPLPLFVGQAAAAEPSRPVMAAGAAYAVSDGITASGGSSGNSSRTGTGAAACRAQPDAIAAKAAFKRPDSPCDARKPAGR